MRLGELELVEQLPSGTAVAELVLNADSRYLYGTFRRNYLADRVRKSADNVVLLNGDDPARFLRCECLSGAPKCPLPRAPEQPCALR